MVERAEQHLVIRLEIQAGSQDVETLGGVMGEGDLVGVAPDIGRRFCADRLARLFPYTAPYMEPGIRLADVQVGLVRTLYGLGDGPDRCVVQVDDRMVPIDAWFR
jgi:hypothetical protein